MVNVTRIFASRTGGRAPILLWVIAVPTVLATLVPLWYLVSRSSGRGWAGWEEVLRGSLAELLWNSAALAATVSLVCVAVALPAAWLVVRSDLAWRRVWSVALSVPLAIPSYVMALAVVAAFGPRGMLQDKLEAVGVDRLPEIYGFWGAALTLSAVSFPYVYLVLVAAFGALDPSEEEASASLGEGRWRTFASVTLPSLAPAIAAGGLLVALYVLSDFGGVSTLRYNTFTRAIFIHYTSSFDRTGAAILGTLLSVFAMVILAAELMARTRYQAHARARRSAVPPPVPLGSWRWPAVGFLCFVALLSLVTPVGVLLYWLVRGVQAGGGFPPLWEPFRHSASLAVAGAAITVGLALPIAVLAARFRGPLARGLEQLTFATHALPGLVVALALVFFGISYATGLYQTIWLLLAAYVILFLPNALGAVRTPLMRQNPHLEEAAASLGRSPLKVLTSVTFPIARPGITAAFALVFLTCMKELPATLLLSPPGFRTLPGVVWGASADALYGRAALPALLLTLTAAIPLAFLVVGGKVEDLES